jgi:hypothetical protein
VEMTCPRNGNFLQPESTLAELGIELMVTKSLQNNSENAHALLHSWNRSRCHQ